MADRYTLERELGRGGMATVYLATDARLPRRVAVKLLHPGLGATLGPERFLREIAFAARLNHPHILPLFDSGQADGRLFYVMPYVEGESLRQRLEREPQLPIEEAVTILQAIAAALAHAHREGVIHRDIKPENILLAREPTGGLPHALVADFGIARALDVAGGQRLTETGLALGTPGYMSPEQAAGSGRLDARSDLYALGCVAYEMLAGVPPFTGPTAQAIMARHAVDPVPPLQTVRSTVPEWVAYAIERALAKVPADRFASAGEFADALVAERPRSAPCTRKLSYRYVMPLLAAGAALLIAGLGLWRIRGSSTPAVITSAATIAVLPILPATADTILSRLGRDLAVTLAATLDGVGEIRTVDRLSLAAATGNRTTLLSLKEGADLGRRFGAKSVLRGTLVRVGPDVRLDLGLYEVAGLGPLVQNITTTAPSDSLGVLTDSIAWSLLRQIWTRGDPPTPSLSAVTTRSVPALRAFLDGERDLGANRWNEAALAYRSAMSADSSFWLAYQRYAETQTWREQEIEPELLDRLARHRDALPDRDRLLVDAIVSVRDDSVRATLGLYEEVTQRFPDYWPGWFLYGDRLVHWGGLLGYRWTRARDALERALAGNPALAPAWHHLFLISAGRDTARPARSVNQLAELGFFRSRPGGDTGYRVLAELSRHEGELPDSLEPLLDAPPPPNVPRSFTLDGAPTNSLMFGFAAAQIEQNRRVLTMGVDPELAAANLRGIALSWASRGAWDSALVAADAAVARDPGPTSALEAYRLTVLGAWIGAIDVSEATKRRRAAWLALQQLPADPPPIATPARLTWLDGILAYARGDRKGLAQARAALGERPLPPDSALRETAKATASFNQRSLAAFERALAGDHRRAGAELASLEWECVGRWSCPVTPYDLAVHHLAGARWLLEAGDTAQATRLLLWHESFQSGSEWTGTFMLTPLALLEMARLESARGATSSAQEYYRQFLRRFDSPIPSQRHLVEQARSALDTGAEKR